MADAAVNKPRDPLHLENRDAGTAFFTGSNDVEHVRTEKEPPLAVDKATERKVLRKLDLRIVPMVMWMYVLLDSIEISL